MAEMLCEMKNIHKNFIGVKALNNVTFNLRKGEVHALLGENGAGKSTLMKILSGSYQPDSGEIVIEGQSVMLRNPHHALQLGISIVHQEPQMVPWLGIAENVCLNAWQTVRGLVSWSKMEEVAREHCSRIGLNKPMDTIVANLSMAEKQMIQIARALMHASKIMIFDEPTSSLTPQEKDALFAIIRRLKSEGMGIIYISHRIEEIFEIADRVTVLKDGQLVGTVPIREVDAPTLVRMMVGRELGKLYPPKSTEFGEELLVVEGLTRKGRFHNVSFTLRRGEVLGFAGLVGSGRSEVALCLFGADAIDGGTITFKGQKVHFRSTAEAIRNRVAFVGEDRHQGMVHHLPVRENISLPWYAKFARFGVMDRKKQADVARKMIGKLNIKTPSEEQLIGKLSGGNQQKVIFGRWLIEDADVFILDEPTRGIDVGAKEEIYQLIRELTSQGKGVILISSELPEILGMSDRVLVMHRGTVAGILSAEEATEENITKLAMGVV